MKNLVTLVRASDLAAGDTVVMTLHQRSRALGKPNRKSGLKVVHKFDQIDMGQGTYLPACVLLVFVDDSTLSVEPSEQFRLAQ